MAEPVYEQGVFDIEDLEAKERAVAEARAELAAGRGVPHEKVRAWLRDLAAGKRTPPPTA